VGGSNLGLQNNETAKGFTDSGIKEGISPLISAGRIKSLTSPSNSTVSTNYMRVLVHVSAYIPVIIAYPRVWVPRHSFW
jgi:hypothetical protein